MRLLRRVGINIATLFVLTYSVTHRMADLCGPPSCGSACFDRQHDAMTSAVCLTFALPCSPVLILATENHCVQSGASFRGIGGVYGSPKDL